MDVETETHWEMGLSRESAPGQSLGPKPTGAPSWEGTLFLPPGLGGDSHSPVVTASPGRFGFRAKKYGPVVRVNVFHKTSVIVTSPESVKVGSRVVSSPARGCMREPWPWGRWEECSGVTHIGAGFPRTQRQRLLPDPLLRGGLLRAGLLDVGREGTSLWGPFGAHTCLVSSPLMGPSAFVGEVRI